MKLWGSRLQKKTDSLMERFHASIGFDRRLWAADIRGSMAYVQALERAGLITTEERDELLRGLEMVQAEFAEDRFQIQPTDEDIHTAVERRLGELAGKLHTGRSRNDQAATDVRLYMLDEIASLREALSGTGGRSPPAADW